MDSDRRISTIMRLNRLTRMPSLLCALDANPAIMFAAFRILHAMQSLMFSLYKKQQILRAVICFIIIYMALNT